VIVDFGGFCPLFLFRFIVFQVNYTEISKDF
jgi:hypothetical protein